MTQKTSPYSERPCNATHSMHKKCFDVEF